MAAVFLICAVGLVCAWRPCETNPTTILLLTIILLAMTPWAARLTAADGANPRWAVVGVSFATALGSALAGFDPATGLSELALLAAVVALAWVASRRPVSPLVLRLFALGLALLAVWAVWQVTVGFSRAGAALAELPPPMRTNAAERIASGRAFASLLVPGHLATLLAAALPLLLAGVRRSLWGALWALGAVLCGLGLALTYSPVGIALGIGAAVLAVGGRWRGVAAAVALLLAAALVAAFLARPDLARLEPLALRADNWRTAAWVWSTAPAAGVGVGGFSQAARRVPFEVGNLPAHAHCLPLEWAADLGMVGVAAALAAAVGLLVLLRRLWREDPALAVAIAVVPVANLVDFSLYSSGVALPWAVLLGWGLAAARGAPPTSAEQPRVRLAALAVAALAVSMSLLHLTSIEVERTAGTDPITRYDAARRSASLAPWRLGPVLTAGTAALDSRRGELEEGALEILGRARWLRPRSASLAALGSQLELALGRAPAAVSEAWLAATEQPRVAARAAALDDLVQRLEAGDGGTH